MHDMSTRFPIQLPVDFENGYNNVMSDLFFGVQPLREDVLKPL